MLSRLQLTRGNDPYGRAWIVLVIVVYGWRGAVIAKWGGLCRGLVGVSSTDESTSFMAKVIFCGDICTIGSLC